MEREQKHYYALNHYLRENYGAKIYKLSLNAGLTCPNRDGKIGTKGCIFCSGGGYGEFAASPLLSITRQIESGKARIKNKTKAGKYIAYFQCYTNTYAPVEYLEKIFLEALSHEDIVILSIATRPDCIPAEVLSLLKRLNRIKPVWVELGLQTVHEKSAEYIRRGYDLKCFDEAVRNLKAVGVKVVVHTILGLPGEGMQEILQTIRYIGDNQIDGIKLQLLHVLKGTDLAADYEKGSFSVLGLEEYIEILIQCIEHLPPDMVIHRITGDGPKALLLAPLWSADKKTVLNKINRAFEKNQICQGKKFSV